jgi:hypothetical protein
MALIGLELKSEPFLEGREFGPAGSYELLTGRAHFAIDPLHPANALITDIELAPRDAAGRVRCSADVSILRPRDPARRNAGLLLDVVNRGNRGLPRAFDVHSVDPTPGRFAVGDGWLLGHGYTVVACGWQHDVPATPGLLRIDVPTIAQDGAPVTGRVACRYLVTNQTQVLTLSDGGHVPYAAVDLDEADATLTVRDYYDDPPNIIPREQWRFARLDGDAVVADASHAYLPAGFEPGRFYEIVYTATGAVPTALGLAATRDLLSFLRHASDAEGNPCAGQLTYALGFGSSQSGAFLRTMLRLGLFQDEQGRMVLDGMLANIAGAFNTELNWRFGQPSYFGPYSLSYAFPFTDAEQTEPTTGQLDGLQRLARERVLAPKVIYTNSSAEYWYLYGALAHLTLADASDAPVPENVRIYHFSGTQHGGATFPLTREGRGAIAGPSSIHPYNSVDSRPLLRAALMHLDRWAREGIEPPPSRYPRVADGTLVQPESLRSAFASIPGAMLPPRLFKTARLDYGGEMAFGIASRVPPAVGPGYPLLVPAVDADGNDLGGVRLPDLTVPIATHTGWNQRDPRIGAPELVGPTLAGATIPFARTEDERRASGDPRLSIEERYVSRDNYLRRVREAAQDLVHEGYLLEADIDTVLASSAERYDAIVGAGVATAR